MESEPLRRTSPSLPPSAAGPDFRNERAGISREFQRADLGSPKRLAVTSGASTPASRMCIVWSFKAVETTISSHRPHATKRHHTDLLSSWGPFQTTAGACGTAGSCPRHLHCPRERRRSAPTSLLPASQLDPAPRDHPTNPPSSEPFGTERVDVGDALDEARVDAQGREEEDRG